MENIFLKFWVLSFIELYIFKLYEVMEMTSFSRGTRIVMQQPETASEHCGPARSC